MPDYAPYTHCPSIQPKTLKLLQFHRPSSSSTSSRSRADRAARPPSLEGTDDHLTGSGERGGDTSPHEPQLGSASLLGLATRLPELDPLP